MAEFKDISLFQTITPTYSELASLYVQVSATEKVSLQQVAKVAGSATMTGFTTPTGTSAVAATDTIISAIRKLAGRTLNAPCRIAWNDSRQIAIAFAKLGIVFSTNTDNPIIQVNSNPSYNLASDPDGTIINGILASGTSYTTKFPIGYKLRSAATGSSQYIDPGEILTCGSNVSVITVSTSFSAGNSSAIVYLLSQGDKIPGITIPSRGKIIKSADWSHIFDDKAGIYVLCFQYLYTASNIKHIAVNAAKYR